MAAGQSLLVAPLLLLHAVGALQPDEQGVKHTAFHAFMRQHGRQYAPGSDEYHQRLALFSRRATEAEAHNARPGRLWTAGINRLSDRTEAELAQLRGWRGGAAPASGAGRGSSFLQPAGNAGTFLSQRARGRPLPEQFMNWTRLSAAKEVTDQGACGSCWAVTSSKVLQMHMEIYRPKTPRTFSAQELVSCVPNPHKCGGTGGCEGATVELAFHWALNHGLAREDEDPYKAVDGICVKGGAGSGGLMQLGLSDLSVEDLVKPGVHKAPAGAPGIAFGMIAWERLPENGYEQLLHALVDHGPVGVAVAARDWAFYEGGVFNECDKDAVVDHAVVLVGYGKDSLSGALFYDIQNSWGGDWGESGHIRLLRHEGDDSWCGIDHQPEVGTVCEGGPKEVKVCGMCGVLYDSSVPHFQQLVA